MGSAVPRRFQIRSALRACKEAQRPSKSPNCHDGQQNEEHPAVEPGGQQMQIEHKEIPLAGYLGKFSKGSRSLEVTGTTGC